VAIKAVIFDFDGTLFSSNESGKKALQMVCEKRGFSFSEKKYDSMDGLTREEKVKRLFPGQWKTIWPECKKIYEEGFKKSIKPIPGAVPCMKKLVKNGVNLFIFSTKPFGLIKIALKKHRCLDYFEEVLGQESIIPPKPNKKGIVFLEKKHGFKPSEALMVGDTVIDENAASAAKIRFVHVKRPRRNGGGVRKCFAKISSLKKLPLLVKRLNKQNQP